MTTNYTGWQDIQTLQSKEILSELLDAKEHQRAILLISDTGLGKSNTIKIFKSKIPQHTFTIVVGDSYKLVDVVDEILIQLGIEKWAKETRLRNKLHTIAVRLREIKNKGGKPVIIIDEAENLKPVSLRMMKELYDAVIDYCSIILIGTEQILETIHNKRKRNRTSVPQLWRRFKAGTRYISSLNKVRDFKPFFQKYVPNDLGVQDLLMELCENYGELHDYLDPLLRYAEKNNKPVNEENFRLIHKLAPRNMRKAS